MSIGQEKQQQRLLQLIQEICELRNQGESLACRPLLQNHCGLLQRMRRYLGSRANALVFAGINPEDQNLRKSPLQLEDLVSLLQNRKAQGKLVNIMSIIKEEGRNSNTLYRLVKFWDRAIQSAGLNPVEERTTWKRWFKKEESRLNKLKPLLFVQTEIQRIVEKGKQIWVNHRLFTKSFLWKNYRYAFCNKISRLGSLIPGRNFEERLKWIAAQIRLKALEDVIMSFPWSTGLILSYGRELVRSREKLASKYLQKNHPKFFKAIYSDVSRIPGKSATDRYHWVLEQLGQKPEDVRDQQHRTLDSIIQESEIIWKTEKKINPAHLRLKHSKLLSVIYSPNSHVPGKSGTERWEYIIKALGLDPKEIKKRPTIKSNKYYQICNNAV